MAHIRTWIIRSALVTASGLALTACASSGPSAFDPKYDTRLPPSSTHEARDKPDRSSPSAPRSSANAKRGGTWKPYQVAGKWYYPEEQPDYDEKGLASWYGDAFNGKPTATGELFDMYALSAAHKTLPLPSIVEVTNLDNGRSMKVRVNDRGPFVDNRIIDLSRGAAEELGMMRAGLARVRVRYVGPAPTPGLPSRDLQYASAKPKPLPPALKPLAPAAPPVELPPIAPEPIELARTEEIAPPQPAPAADPAPVIIAVRYEIQAGAFSSRANAERAASQLAGAGITEIRETERNGQILYRVVVSRLSDEAAADAALEKVAANGYADAVLRRLN